MSLENTNTVIITCGDVNGIGPEICLKTIRNCGTGNEILIMPHEVFLETVKLTSTDIPYNLVKTKDSLKHNTGQIQVLSPGEIEINPSKTSAEAGRISYNAIIKAYELVRENPGSFMVTAPISKESFGLAGIDFPGHTELIASLCNSENFMMMFLSDVMKGAIVTIHEPLASVSEFITENNLAKAGRIIKKSLIYDLGIKEPSIAVLGLNPHAGESGRIGREEEDVIKPFIKNAAGSFAGPFPPDGFFGAGEYRRYDAILAMYHDQLLIPFKMSAFDKGVNFTAGLPIIRTSPDHGTAFGIAWKNIASAGSMIEAVRWGKIISNNRKEYAE